MKFYNYHVLSKFFFQKQKNADMLPKNGIAPLSVESSEGNLPTRLNLPDTDLIKIMIKYFYLYLKIIKKK